MSTESIAARAQSRIGKTLSGKWRLEAMLGVGGMAAVYRARHERNGISVALKLMHPEYSANPSMQALFLREGYAANRIAHPGIARVLDDGEEAGDRYLVMDLLEGKTLKQLWREHDHKLPVDEVVRWIAELLSVLEKAHEAGVLHRDIKPDNAFITNDGVLKVLDFGVAAVRVAADDEVASGRAPGDGTFGTPAFMAPEQARSEWTEVDERSDLFSVGASAWLLLTGQLVHDVDDVKEMVIAAALRRAPPITSIDPDVSIDLGEVIDKALSFEKNERYANAGEMREAWLAAARVRADALAATNRVAPKPMVRTRAATVRLDELVESPAKLKANQTMVVPRDPFSGTRRITPEELLSFERLRAAREASLRAPTIQMPPRENAPNSTRFTGASRMQDDLAETLDARTVRRDQSLADLARGYSPPSFEPRSAPISHTRAPSVPWAAIGVVALLILTALGVLAIWLLRRS